MASIESRIVKMAEQGRFPHPMSRRAFISAAAAAGIGVTLAACGDDSEQSDDTDQSPATSAGPVTTLGTTATTAAVATTTAAASVATGPMWCQVTTLSNDFFGAFNDGAQQFTSALDLELTTFEDDANVNTALSQIGNIETAGGQMLFGTPATEAQAAAVIEACEAAGIMHGSAYTSPKFLTPADRDTWIRFLTPPSVAIAAGTARALFEEVGGEGVIVHVPGQPGSTADDERTAGLMLAGEEFPNIEIVTTSPGNWVSEDARVAFSNALPGIDDFAGVFAQNDSEAAGVIATLEAQTISDKVVTGFDGNAQNIQLIAEGKQYITSATIGGLTAGLLGIAVFDALNGVEFQLPERFMYQGAVLVNPEFAQEFLDNVYAGDLPFEWARMSRALHPDDWDPQTLLKPIVPSEFFAGAEQGDYTLNDAWSSADDLIASVQAEYDERFVSGPLAAYKSSMVV